MKWINAGTIQPRIENHWEQSLEQGAGTCKAIVTASSSWFRQMLYRHSSPDFPLDIFAFRMPNYVALAAIDWSVRLGPVITFDESVRLKPPMAISADMHCFIPLYPCLRNRLWQENRQLNHFFKFIRSIEKRETDYRMALFRHWTSELNLRLIDRLGSLSLGTFPERLGRSGIVKGTPQRTLVRKLNRGGRGKNCSGW
jgi:hypothetical protein